MTKKNPNKFTIGFKKTNASHQRVVEILNNTEDKADFIATAILQYIGEGDTIDHSNTDKSSLLPLIEAVVKKEIQKVIAGKEAGCMEEICIEENDVDISEQKEESPVLDERIMENIANALDAFRGL